MLVTLLDTDYLVDNGLIQIREDGGYIGRHNPIFLAKLENNYFPYPFFDFNDSEALVTCSVNNAVQILALTQVPVENMYIESDANHASIFMERGNQLFNFTQEETVYQGVRFVNMSVTLNSVAEGVSLDSIDFVLHTKGPGIQVGNTVALIDPYVNVCGQLIFNESQPSIVRTLTSENPSCLELMYNLQGKSETNIQLFVGVYQFTLTPDTSTLLANVKTCLDKVSDMPLNVFDYRSAIESWNISYIVLRDPESIPRFSNDPMFSLVFINKAVAIFKVNRDIS